MNNFLISPINNVDMQIDLKTKQNKISNSYLKYEDDLHLPHRNRIDYVKKFIDLDFDFSQLHIDKNILKHLATMKANKKRLISQHFINSNHNQNLALINNDAFDCRKENHISVSVISALSGDYILSKKRILKRCDFYLEFDDDSVI
ncbi:hypothetical protein ACH7GM_001744 [Campylobacter upsaliensis]|uniref:hypothetical protein n=1 Tax=Campylobacter upsaliensis TaxID=28080 RepID=UPI00127BAC2A|nr:hypothetical protein [Campylobacter upsaliensis]EAH5553864.1 hypothetical protein [Campylobacter upsaliensis]EAI6143958.1 hypothetical protein [Campylobacter upsaliensis]EAI7265071.1 hypothetical protein [Campylobacter upsaliensis]EAJ2438444.1 hypothetical protein [Campylobacter upsaliensis]EAJ7399217.1 hypothetical protein [Campylobacter upsaliensis]